MTFLRILLFAIVLGQSALAIVQTPTVSYAREAVHEFRIHHSEKLGTLPVSATLAGERDGTTVISCVAQWGFMRDMAGLIHALEAPQLAEAAVQKLGPCEWQITHPAGATFEIRYHVKTRDADGVVEDVNRGLFYLPFASRTRLHLFGMWLFVAPEDDARVSVEWRGFPESWTLASTRGLGKRVEADSIDEARRSVYYSGKEVLP